MPPILPIVLYNGKRRWQAARDIAELILPLPGGLAQYTPQARYLLIDEQRLNMAELASLQNLSAALFRLENSRTPQDIAQVLATLGEWLRLPEHTGLRRAFAVWIKRVLLPGRLPGIEIPEMRDIEEVQTMLAETVQEWTRQWQREGWEKGRREGRRDGLHEGRQEGEALLLQRILAKKFGELPEEYRRRLVQADADTLLAWGERVVLARTLDEIFL